MTSKQATPSGKSASAAACTGGHSDTGSLGAKSSPKPKFTAIDMEHTYHYIYKDGVFTMQYNHDGTKLAVGFGDHGIELIDTLTGKKIKELCPHRYGSLGAMCVRYSPTQRSRLLVSTSEGVVYNYDTETGASKQIVIESNNEINCMDFAADGTKFATAGKDMDIRIYDARSARRICLIAGYNTHNTVEDTGGHAQRIFAIRFVPGSSNIFITGGWDNNLKVWDFRTPNGVQRIVSGPHLAGDGMDIKNNQILTGSWRAKDGLQMWDLGSGKLIDTYPLAVNKSHKDSGGEFLYCARFFRDGSVLAGGSGTQSIQAIDTNTKQVIGEVSLGAPVHAVDCTKDRQFAVGGLGKELYLASLH